MEKFLSIFKQKIFWRQIFILFLLFCLYVAIKILTNIYITVQFDELAPFESNMPVYYKGFKVGHARNIKPSKDFKHTLVNIVITYKNLRLPKNTIASVKKIKRSEREGDFDYIDLEYPDSPSIYYLKTGSVIKGKTSLSWDTLIAQQADKGTLDDIAGSIDELLASLKDTTDALETVFVTINEILTENRPNLLASSKNLSTTTANLQSVSLKMNNSLSQERLDNTTSGFEGSSRNIDETTKNLKDISKNINDMMPYIDATIIDANSTVCNVNQISAGILETLQKRLGLMKLLLGKPVDKKKCCP